MKKLLAVIDMQKDFAGGALGTPEAVAIVPAVAEKIRTFDGDVVFTADTHGSDYMNTREGKHLPVPHCIKGTEGWLFDSAIAPLAEGKVIFEKHDNFGSYALAAYAAGRGYDYIELIGLCTDICVLPNALLLKAMLPEADIAVDPACCAGVTPESHDNALKAMAMCQNEIL